MKAAPRALTKKRVMKQESKSTSLGSQSSEDTVTKGLTKKAKIELALQALEHEAPASTVTENIITGEPLELNDSASCFSI